MTYITLISQRDQINITVWSICTTGNPSMTADIRFSMQLQLQDIDRDRNGYVCHGKVLCLTCLECLHACVNFSQ